VCGGLAVACWTAPIRVEIWIKISIPCATLLRLWDTNQWIPEPGTHLRSGKEGL